MQCSCSHSSIAVAWLLNKKLLQIRAFFRLEPFFPQSFLIVFPPSFPLSLSLSLILFLYVCGIRKLTIYMVVSDVASKPRSKWYFILSRSPYRKQPEPNYLMKMIKFPPRLCPRSDTKTPPDLLWHWPLALMTQRSATSKYSSAFYLSITLKPSSLCPHP